MLIYILGKFHCLFVIQAIYCLPQNMCHPEPMKQSCRCNQVKMSSLVWVLDPNRTGVLVRGKFGHRHTDRENGHVKVGAETGGMQL